MRDAVRQAGEARFRAILLTSLTTSAGVTPLMLEKSLQAQFLIPNGRGAGLRRAGRDRRDSRAGPVALLDHG